MLWCMFYRSFCICRFCRVPVWYPGIWVWSVVAGCLCFCRLSLCQPEEVSNHSDFGSVIGEGGPFVAVTVVGCVHLGVTLYLCSQFGYVVDGEFIVVCYGSYVLPFCNSLFS